MHLHHLCPGLNKTTICTIFSFPTILTEMHIVISRNSRNFRHIRSSRYTKFINGRLAILKKLKCLQLKKELNKKKDRIKRSHYV